MHRRIAWRASLMLVAAVIALSATTIVAAQSSTNFQLGCWGVVSGDGGTRTLTNTKSGTKRTLTDSTGQWFAGEEMLVKDPDTSVVKYIIRSGYIQPFNTSIAAAIESDPAAIGQGADIYLPVLHNYFRIVYVCPY